jgi:hypothetical protein
MLWVAGVLVRGVEAIWAFLFRRRRLEPPVDPAEELRRKLAEASERELEPEPRGHTPESPLAQAVAEPETVAGAEEPKPSDLESLRRGLHERARALTEEMRGTSEDS